jgi:hypothetical protein
MAVENIYWWYVSGFYETGGSSPGGYIFPSTWSLDVEIPPHTIYAFGSLSNVTVVGTPSTAFCGISSYWVRIEGEDVPIIPPEALLNAEAVAPGIFDDNVSSVSFLYGVFSGSADCIFQVFGFG